MHLVWSGFSLFMLVGHPAERYNKSMKANIGLTATELQKLNFVYAPEASTPAVPLSAPTIMTGRSAVKAASARPVLVALRPLHGEPVSARDALYLQTSVATDVLSSSESAVSFVEAVIQSLPPSKGEKEAFARTPLDDNLCRLRALFADMQRPSIVERLGGKDATREAVSKTVSSLAKESRQYVAEVVGKASSLEKGLSPAEFEAVQNFNHLQRVMSEVFQMQIDGGEIFLDSSIRPSVSLDDADRGGMNRIFGSISPSGTNRPFYMKYMPFHLLSMYGTLFKQALSRPPQLAAVTTRPGPLKLPKSLANRYGIPQETPVTYHSVSRYGLSNQKDTGVGEVPMKFYYTYESEGVSKVLELDRKEHFYTQLSNRPALKIPVGLMGNKEELSLVYVMHDRQNQAYIFKKPGARVGDPQYNFTQQQYQKVLQYNATPELLNDPNSPVHLTTDGSLRGVMNKIFNTNAVRVVSSQGSFLLPKTQQDRMQLMEELIEVLSPDFTREQDRICALRQDLFRKFADQQVDKGEIENTCRLEAVKAYRQMTAQRRLNVPTAAGMHLISETVVEIDKNFDELWNKKAKEFARTATARLMYAKEEEPFFSAAKRDREAHNGMLNVTRAFADLPEEERVRFDAAVAKMTEDMEAPGGFKDQLQGVFWKAVTQDLMDRNYGPEGTVSGGTYISREGLPANSEEFKAYLKQSAPELVADPVQVANRLSSTFAYYAYNISPYYSVPWPNLFRNNDRIRNREQLPNEQRDPRTYKPTEPPVILTMNVAGVNVRMTGTRLREQPTGPAVATQPPTTVGTAPVDTSMS